MKPITPAGQRLIARYKKLKAAGALKPIRDGLGNAIEGDWLRVGVGNGQELATAKKLANDGHATLIGGAHNHWMMLK